jgi:hypothetical protein
MTEDNLQRLDTALRLLAVVSQDLSNLRALMTQPEPEKEPTEELGRWVNVTALMPLEERVLNFLASCDVPYFSSVEHAAEEAKHLFHKPTEGGRDHRKSNALRVVKVLIEKGYLRGHHDGSIGFDVT